VATRQEREGGQNGSFVFVSLKEENGKEQSQYFLFFNGKDFNKFLVVGLLVWNQMPIIWEIRPMFLSVNVIQMSSPDFKSDGRHVETRQSGMFCVMLLVGGRPLGVGRGMPLIFWFRCGSTLDAAARPLSLERIWAAIPTRT
jgi:hypothetical protein